MLLSHPGETKDPYQILKLTLTDGVWKNTEDMRVSNDGIGWFYNSFIIENDLILINMIQLGIKLYDFDLKLIKHITPNQLKDYFNYGISIFAGLLSDALLVGGKLDVSNELKFDKLQNQYNGNEDGGAN